MRAVKEAPAASVKAADAQSRRAAAPRKAGEHHKSAEVRERILNATLEVAREHGYQGLTIARVSAASGMPSGSVYWHFVNKDGLLLAALDMSFQRQLVVLEEQAPHDGEDVHAYVDRTFESIEANGQPWGFWRIGATLVADETVPEQLTLQRFREVRAETRALYTSWWRRVLPENELTPPAHGAEDFANLLLVVHDGVSLSLAADDSNPQQMRALAAALHGMVDSVLRAQTAANSA